MKKINKKNIILYYLAALFVIVGALFKIMHYPGASAMLIIGFIFTIVFFVLLIKKRF